MCQTKSYYKTLIIQWTKNPLKLKYWNIINHLFWAQRCGFKYNTIGKVITFYTYVSYVYFKTILVLFECWQVFGRFSVRVSDLKRKFLHMIFWKSGNSRAKFARDFPNSELKSSFRCLRQVLAESLCLLLTPFFWVTHYMSLSFSTYVVTISERSNQISTCNFFNIYVTH